MPCYTRSTYTVALDSTADPVLLFKALQAEGFYVAAGGRSIVAIRNSLQVEITLATGTLNVLGDRSRTFEQTGLNSLKRAYSREAIKSASVRFGWRLETNKANPNALTMRRR